MSTPLTDAINALTTYANGVTGQSDTNLSDAVHTLADGYGQGGGTENVTITVLDNFGMRQGVYVPPNATWTGLVPDMDTGEMKGVLTIPQNSMFTISTLNTGKLVTSGVTSERINIGTDPGNSYIYVCYVGTTDGRVEMSF